MAILESQHDNNTWQHRRAAPSLANVLTPLSTVSYWFSLSMGYTLIFKCAVVYTVWDSEELPLNKHAQKKLLNQPKLLLTSIWLYKWGQAHLFYTLLCPRLICLRWFYGLLPRRAVFKDLSDTSSLSLEENISKGMEDSFWMGQLLDFMMNTLLSSKWLHFHV